MRSREGIDSQSQLMNPQSILRQAGLHLPSSSTHLQSLLVCTAQPLSSARKALG